MPDSNLWKPEVVILPEVSADADMWKSFAGGEAECWRGLCTSRGGEVQNWTGVVGLGLEASRLSS